MRIVNRSLGELGINEESDERLEARRIIQEVVLSTTHDLGRLGVSVFSGFNGACVNGDLYTPTSEHIVSGTLFANTADGWVEATMQNDVLSDVGDYAAFNEVPAVGVYDISKFDQVWALRWTVKDGLSIPETCTDIYIWS